MKQLLIFASILLFIASCKKEDALTIVYPKDYLPAYPGTTWYYSNGDISKVHFDYVAHQYMADLNSTQYTAEKLVPYIDHEYLYEYKITQNSMLYPLKKLLSETKNSPWIVDEAGGKIIYRETTQVMDSMYLRFPSDENSLDSTLYYDILVVVEFLEDNDNTTWNTKEYYSKNVGLIRVEINNPEDTIASVVQKQLIQFNPVN